MRSTSGARLAWRRPRGSARSDPISAARKGAYAEALLDQGGDGVVPPHEAGTPHPADAGRDQADVAAPVVVLAPLAAEEHLEGGLGLPVDAIAAKRALVGGQGEDDGDRAGASSSCGQTGHAGDEALEAEELDADGDLRRGAGPGEVADGGDGGEGHEDGRHEGVEARGRAGPAAAPPGVRARRRGRRRRRTRPGWPARRGGRRPAPLLAGRGCGTTSADPGCRSTWPRPPLPRPAGGGGRPRPRSIPGWPR